MRPSMVLLLFSFTECQLRYTDEDFDVVVHLSKFLNSQCFVFVGDNRDVELLRRVRAFSQPGFYSSVLGSRLLENIIEKNTTQLSFLRRRTVIVAKESNLTALLDKILVPRLLTWVILENYVDYKASYIPINSAVLFVHSTPTLVTINQVYHAKPGAGKTVTTVWTWQENAKPFLTLDHRRHFHNISLRAHFIYDKEVCHSIHGKLMRIKIECLHRDIVELMKRRLNFSLIYIECHEKKHPYAYPNGSDSVIFIRLKNKEVDISLPSHIISQLKFERLDFVWPTFVLRSMMYLKQTRIGAYWMSYLRPLHPSIWCGIFLWILITGVFLLVFEKILFNKLKLGIFLVVELLISVLKALQVFCNQAEADIPTSTSIRFLYLLKLFVFVVFFQAYCAYLVSSLMIVIPYYPFSDLKGFFEKNEYQMMTLQQEFQRFYYRKVIGAGKRPNFMLPDEELPLSVQEGVDRLCKNAHLTFVDFRENLLDVDAFKCKMSELPSPVSYLNMGLAFPKNSPYSEFINKEMMYIRSTGIMKKLNSRLYAHPDFHDKKSDEDYITVSMTEVLFVFILLGVGTFLSVLIFTAEVFTFKIQNSQRSTRNKARKSKKYSIMSTRVHEEKNKEKTKKWELKII